MRVLPRSESHRGRTDSIKTVESHRKIKARQTRYIQQVVSETQRVCCEVFVTLRV